MKSKRCFALNPSAVWIRLVGAAVLMAAMMTLSGCGNSEVEARVYEHFDGYVSCKRCWEGKYTTISSGFPNYDVQKFPNYDVHKIESVSSKKGPVASCWIVKVFWDCPNASPKITRHQFSTYEVIYRDKRIRSLKEIDHPEEGIFMKLIRHHWLALLLTITLSWGVVVIQDEYLWFYDGFSYRIMIFLPWAIFAAYIFLHG